MKEVKVVAIVGMPGAGKSYCVNRIVEHGIPSVYFGGITIDEVKARGMEVTEANEKFVREDIRAKEGKGAYAKRIIAKIEQLFKEGYPRVVADGLYSWTEYKIFKEIWDDEVAIIAVAAPRQLRHDRLIHRHVRPLTDEEVTTREYAEIENLEKGGPIANADYTLLNGTTPEELIGKLDALLRDIGFLK